MNKLIKVLTFNKGRIMVTGIPKDQIKTVYNTLRSKGFNNCYKVMNKGFLNTLHCRNECIALVLANTDITRETSYFHNIPFESHKLSPIYYAIAELTELTRGKSLSILENELAFHLKQGKGKDGATCNHIQREIDKHINRRYTSKYYVTMINYVKSDKDNISKFIVACDTLKQAKMVERYAKLHNEMKHVYRHESKPIFKPATLASWKHYDELGKVEDYFKHN